MNLTRMNLTRRTRRVLVALSALLYALIFVPALSSLPFILGVVALQFALFFYVAQRSRNSYTDADANLDERQLSEKLRIYRQSYHVVVGLAVLLVLLNLFVSRALWSGLTVAFLMLILSLPTYLLLWLEPDPPPEDMLRGTAPDA